MTTATQIAENPTAYLGVYTSLQAAKAQIEMMRRAGVQDLCYRIYLGTVAEGGYDTYWLTTRTEIARALTAAGYTLLHTTF